MNQLFSERITRVPRSFIREILKVSLQPDMISFAGGLPNKNYFPTAAIQEAANTVLSNMGSEALQYSNSEGLAGLRQVIADRYLEKQSIKVDPDHILITNGSQQGLDLLGKVLLDPGDVVLIEEPGYLGAIQSLSMYQPDFVPVQLGRQGLDVDDFADKAAAGKAKMVYTVPTFQNPSGVSYSEDSRKRIADIAVQNNILLLEDDPYGALRFRGTSCKPIYGYAPEWTVLLGTFSKTIAPGFRLGWIVAPGEIYDKLVTAKQAADLHTSSINQHILLEYFRTNSLDDHLQTIIDAYGRQCREMIEAGRKYLPEEVHLWEPEGGMFLWGQLPDGYDSMKLFEYAVREKVVYVPGEAFFTNGRGKNSFRLSFSCVESDMINLGMQRLARAFERYLQDR